MSMHDQYDASVSVPRRLWKVRHRERGKKTELVHGRLGVAPTTRLQGETLLPIATQSKREYSSKIDFNYATGAPVPSATLLHVDVPNKSIYNNKRWKFWSRCCIHNSARLMKSSSSRAEKKSGAWKLTISIGTLDGYRNVFISETKPQTEKCCSSFSTYFCM